MVFIVHRGGIMMFSLVYSSTNVLEFGLLFNCWWAPPWCFLRPAYYKCQISLFLSVNSQPRACYTVYRSILGTFGWRKHVFTVSALSSISLVDPFFWTMPGCAVFIFFFTFHVLAFFLLGLHTDTLIWDGSSDVFPLYRIVWNESYPMLNTDTNKTESATAWSLCSF